MMEKKRPISVALAYVERIGKVLLLKRNNEPFLGLWSMVGGKVHWGEHPEDAIIREIKEETGVEVEGLMPAATMSEHIIRDGAVDIHLMVSIYRCRAKGSDLLESDEGELMWVDKNKLEEMENMSIPSDFRIIIHIRDSGERKHFRSVVEETDSGYIVRELSGL